MYVYRHVRRNRLTELNRYAPCVKRELYKNQQNPVLTHLTCEKLAKFDGGKPQTSKELNTHAEHVIIAIHPLHFWMAPYPEKWKEKRKKSHVYTVYVERAQWKWKEACPRQYVYMYIDKHVYTYIHIYVYIYIHIYICIYICICIYMYTYTCIYLIHVSDSNRCCCLHSQDHTHSYAHTCIYILLYTRTFGMYVYVFKHAVASALVFSVFWHMLIYICIYIYTHIHTHTHTHTHTHIYICT